tara:strand:- start:325 stop:687 length:363 start_codon:yes stop_codon:yes gene_type:complete
MKIYLAGPMTGLPYHNFPAFDNGKAILEMQGHEVVSPADLDREGGYDPFSGSGTVPDRITCMKRDLPALLGCDIVVILPNSGSSEGVRLEKMVAKYCDIPCHNFSDFAGLTPLEKEHVRP